MPGYRTASGVHYYEKDYTEVIKSLDPIAYWPMGERWNATAYDVTPVHFNGAITGATLGRPGIGDGLTSMLFDGLNDDIDTTVSINTNNNWSATGWTRIANKASGSQQTWFGSHQGNRFYIGVEDVGDYSFAYGDAFKNTVPSAAITNGVWFHWALVGDSGTARYYVDGVQVDTVAYGGVGAQARSNLIGARNNAAGDPERWMGGDMAHCAIFDRTITPAEIQLAYRARWTR